MTTAALAIWHVALTGTADRRLTPRQASAVMRARNGWPEPLPALAAERASLYGGDEASAAADVAVAWWAVNGLPWTVDGWADASEAMETIGERDE